MKRQHSSAFSDANREIRGDVALRQSAPCLDPLTRPDEFVCNRQDDLPDSTRISSSTSSSSSSPSPLSETRLIEDVALDSERDNPRDASAKTDSTNSCANMSFNPSQDCKTGIIFEDSQQHVDPHNRLHPERPVRVTSIYDTLVEAGIHKRCTVFEFNSELPSNTSSEIWFLDDHDFLRVHIPGYMLRLEQLAGCTCQDKLNVVAQQFQSIFLTPDSVRSAKNAASSLCRLVSRVVQGQLDNGFAVIRPPGHHAGPGMAGGYCILNNVAVAAAYARDYLGVEKVLIVDWDVHHGNGTQAAFLNDRNVMYISVHRWQGGNFYPYESSAGPSMVGVSEGVGFNVNVGWNRKGMGDNEYFATWSNLVMPLAREYGPDLVLVSAGFDAASGDMGECHVSPECFGKLTQSLMTLSDCKVVCSLEGGYVRSVLGKCVLCVVEALLLRQADYAEINVELDDIDVSAAACIRATMAAQRPYWQCIEQVYSIVPTENSDVGS